MNIEIIPDGIDTDKKQILTQQHEDLAEYCQNCYVDAHLKLYDHIDDSDVGICLLYTSPSPRDRQKSRMPSSA